MLETLPGLDVSGVEHHESSTTALTESLTSSQLESRELQDARVPPGTQAAQHQTNAIRSALDHRRLRRRITNQRSAQRMRERRQEEISSLQNKVSCLAT